MFFFLLLLIIIAVFLEGTVITLPLVLVCLLCLTIIKRDAIVYPIAFFAGLLLDLLKIQTAGMSSLFFVIFVLLILLYQRKYEINSYPFVIFSSFLGSAIFLIIFGYANWLIESLISVGLSLILFLVMKKLHVVSIK